MRNAKLMLAVAAVIAPGVGNLLPAPKPKKLFLHADQERLDKAQAKRDRKAKRLATQAQDTPKESIQ